MISFVNLIQPRVSWDESLNEGLITSGWPVGASLDSSLMWETQHTMRITIP